MIRSKTSRRRTEILLRINLKIKGILRLEGRRNTQKILVTWQASGVTDVYAHRGAHLETRENTLDAFREARAPRSRRSGAGRAPNGRWGAGGAPRPGRRTSWSSPRATRPDLPGFVPHLAESLEELRGLRVNVEIKNSRDPTEPDLRRVGHPGARRRGVRAGLERDLDSHLLL